MAAKSEYLIYYVEFIILSVITYKMTISERILKVLKDRNMTQVEFAKQVDIATSTISEWKKRKTNPAADKIISIYALRSRFRPISVAASADFLFCW